jgi:hypothetical protein
MTRSEFDRCFLAPSGGAKDRWDVRQHVQRRGREARPGSVAWFLHTLREGPYTSLGSYPRYWLTQCGETLSWEGCRQNAARIARSIRDGRIDGLRHTDGWCVVGCDVNWEDPEMECAETGLRIESAYAEDQAADSADQSGDDDVCPAAEHTARNSSCVCERDE